MSIDQKPTAPNPKTDEEWAIHALNIHGTFFERWCKKVVETTAPWCVTTSKYPVAFAGEQSELDIRADLCVAKRRLILLIECKKHNPLFVEWVFFPKTGGNESVVSAPYIKTASQPHRTVRVGVRRIEIPNSGLVVADDARETKGHYQNHGNKPDKTKTANNSITDAAMQVSLATSAIEFEERQFARQREEMAGQQTPPLPPFHSDTNIVPVIVTTAKMFFCEFDANDIAHYGEIPLPKAKLVSTPIVIYEFPLPNYLHSPLPLNWSDERVRRQIIIVQSAYFTEFLQNVAHQLLPSV